MALLPSLVKYCWVTAQYLAGVVDGTDEDLLPDGVGVEGAIITFTASVDKVVLDAVPVTISLKPVACSTDREGFLYRPGAALDTNGLASDADRKIGLIAISPGMNPAEFKWIFTVTDSTHNSIVKGSFVPLPDSTVDLSSVGDVPSSPSTEMVAWAETVQKAETARDVAIGAAADAQDAQVAAEAAETAAASSATGAAGSATAASSSSTAAATSATAAASSASGATVAKTAAEAARDLALAQTFAGTLVASGTNANTLTTPGVYYVDGGWTTTALNWPLAGQNGSLHVLPLASGGVVQVFHPASSISRGTWERRYITSTWYAWKSFPPIRFDQTAGRAVFAWDEVNSRDQLVYYDSGWRDISGLLTNGWTAAALRARRRGYGVVIQAEGLNGAAATSGVFTSALPSPSWTPDQYYASPRVPLIQGNAVDATRTASIDITTFTLSIIGAAYTGCTSGRFTMSYEVGSLPTTLPGTAIGTIPNA